MPADPFRGALAAPLPATVTEPDRALPDTTTPPPETGSGADESIGGGPQAPVGRKRLSGG